MLMLSLRVTVLMSLGLVIADSRKLPAAVPEPQALFNQAVQLFFDAKPVESAQVFDQLAKAVPAAEPDQTPRAAGSPARAVVSPRRP